MSELNPEQLDWQGLRFLDPVGRVFRHEGEIYRAIYPKAVGHVRWLFESGVIDDLVERQLLVETTRSGVTVAGYPLVLHHRSVPYPSRPGQWPRALVRDAARHVVDLNLELLKRGLGTIDFHPANVDQIDACRPVWLDLGSIQPLTATRRTPRAILGQIRRQAREGRLKKDLVRNIALRRAGISGVPEEFRRNHLYPLALLAKDVRWSRSVRLLLDSGGISDDEYHLFSRRAWIERFGRDRRAWLESMRDWLSALEFPAQRTKWENYYGFDPFPTESASTDPRSTVIETIIRDQRPRKVVDLGCNAGFSTALALRASPGCQVYAVDSDEGALEVLYGARDRFRHGSVTVALDDVMTLSQDYLQIQGDLTLALALSHHLYFRQYCRFPVIANILSSFTKEALLTEFMPNGLGRMVPQPDPLPADYSLDEFARCLKQHFREVEVIAWPVPSGHSPRIFLHARRSR